MKRLLTAITMAAAFGAVPAHAEDEEEIGILAALGLTAAEGKTEVSDKGAELEGWMLASGTLANAAQAIVKVKNTERLNVAVPASDAIAARPATATTPAIEARDRVEARPLILLSGETKFDLGAYYSATGSIGAAQAQLNKAAITCGRRICTS